MRRDLTLLFGLCVVLIAVFGLWRIFAPPAVELVQPTRGPAVEAVHATGLVEPGLEIRIAPRVGGRIVELKVDEGSIVKKGQLLARLEDADLQASVAELEARVEYAKAQYERNLELQHRDLVSQETVDRTRADLDATRATLRRTREQLGFMSLVAPSDGRIIRRDGEIGEFIPVNQAVFYMAGPAPLRITADIDEEDAPRVKPGLSVLIRADAFPDRTFEGTVSQVTPRGDPIARSYRARVALPADHPLQIGMTAEINIIAVRRDNALLVPTSAVAGGHLWVVRDGRAEQRAVTVGVTGAERTEIRSGIGDGDRVVANPGDRLRPGRRVRVIDGGTATAAAQP
jgi:RND family efflux transporter MFP subunit